MTQEVTFKTYIHIVDRLFFLKVSMDFYLSYITIYTVFVTNFQFSELYFLKLSEFSYYYSSLMFTIPIGVFFGAKQILLDHFQLEPPLHHLGGAVAAVLVVNLIILAYIIKAFKEENKTVPKKDD